MVVHIFCSLLWNVLIKCRIVCKFMLYCVCNRLIEKIPFTESFYLLMSCETSQIVPIGHKIVLLGNHLSLGIWYTVFTYQDKFLTCQKVTDLLLDNGISALYVKIGRTLSEGNTMKKIIAIVLMLAQEDGCARLFVNRRKTQ